VTQKPHVDFIDPEDKDGTASQSTREKDAETNAANAEEANSTETVELKIGDPHFMDDAYDLYADLRA